MSDEYEEILELKQHIQEQKKATLKMHIELQGISHS